MDEMTVDQAAPLLKIHRATVIRWCQSGKIAGAYLPRRSRRIGYRLPRASVLMLLEEVERAALSQRVPA